MHLNVNYIDKTIQQMLIPRSMLLVGTFVWALLMSVFEMSWAYNWWGLTGTGAALALSLLIDCVMLYAVMNIRYGYAMSRDVVRYMGVLLPFALMSFLITMTDSSVVYWVMGCLLVLSSSAVSIYILHNKTSLWEKLVQKIGQKLHL